MLYIIYKGMPKITETDFFIQIYSNFMESANDKMPLHFNVTHDMLKYAKNN